VVTVFIWLGYLGAWLLFAGPIWQAAVELREEGWSEEEAVEFQHLAHSVPEPERYSAWWWLLPPVAYVLAMRRRGRWQKAVAAIMPRETRARIAGLQNKATGWFIVAAGALLIGLKESAELVEHLEWPPWALAPVIVVPFLLGVAHTATRMSRAHRDEERAKAEGDAADSAS